MSIDFENLVFQFQFYYFQKSISIEINLISQRFYKEMNWFFALLLLHLCKKKYFDFISLFSVTSYTKNEPQFKRFCYSASLKVRLLELDAVVNRYVAPFTAYNF